MTTARDRVICVELTDAEWKAFIARHPEPVDWLRAQVLAEIDGAAETTPARKGVGGEGASRPWSQRRV